MSFPVDFCHYFSYLNIFTYPNTIERLHVVSLMMSHDVIKFNFHTMSLPILLDIGSCPEKLQIKFESVSSYG